jgi:hypothetical protein
MMNARIGVTSLAVIGLGMLLLLVLTDVITFSFHYPRNELLFQRPFDQVTPSQLQDAVRQWSPGNYVRVGLLAVATVSALRGLMSSGTRT